MSVFFQFGEQIEGFDYKVINERDARASAGIMFLLGLSSLFSVFIFHTLFWAELFSITFIFEFIIRTFINPKHAPHMRIGGVLVANQHPSKCRSEKFTFCLGKNLRKEKNRARKRTRIDESVATFIGQRGRNGN